MNFASGNSRTRVGAWATVSVLCSTRPLGVRRSARRPEPEQVAEELPAGALGVVVEGRLEGGDRLLEALLGDEPEHAPHAPGLKALPPEARAGAARSRPCETRPASSPGKPRSSTWKRTSTGTSARRGCLAEQPGEDVGAASPGAADEHDRRRVGHRAPGAAVGARPRARLLSASVIAE